MFHTSILLDFFHKLIVIRIFVIVSASASPQKPAISYSTEMLQHDGNGRALFKSKWANTIVNGEILCDQDVPNVAQTPMH